MTTTSGEAKDSRALAALTKLGRDGVERPTAAELDRGLNALFAHIAAGKNRRRRIVRWSLVGVAATLGVLAALRVTSVSPHRVPTPESLALAYQVEGGSVLEGGYLRESGDTGVQLLFNEGSRVDLVRGARGRLLAVDKAGARIAIDHGKASFQITPGNNRQWSVEAGPFVVAVKGTAFTVLWDPSSEQFTLRLRQGRVVVSGPLTGGDLALRAGQRLMVNLPKAETLITEDKPEDAVDNTFTHAKEPPPWTPPIAADSALRVNAPLAPRPGATAAKIDGKRRWAADLANGQWDHILDDVERGGVEATLDRASSEDLFTIATAARYRRRTELARAALLALRHRFPASPRSLDAVFLLGRVEELRQDGKPRAITWYDDYLARAATGAYAAEALGRKMILTDDLRGHAEARPIAEEYLRRFPQGSYAGTARALCRVP